MQIQLENCRFWNTGESFSYDLDASGWMDVNYFTKQEEYQTIVIGPYKFIFRVEQLATNLNKLTKSSSQGIGKMFAYVEDVQVMDLNNKKVESFTGGRVSGCFDVSWN